MTFEGRHPNKKAEDKARIPEYISPRVSQDTLTELMQILKIDTSDRRLFHDMFKISSDYITFVDSVIQPETHQRLDIVRLTNSDSDVSCIL